MIFLMNISERFNISNFSFINLQYIGYSNKLLDLSSIKKNKNMVLQKEIHWVTTRLKDAPALNILLHTAVVNMLANFDELFIGETIIAWPPPLVEERMMPGTSLLAVFSVLNIPEWHCFCMNDQIDVLLLTTGMPFLPFQKK